MTKDEMFGTVLFGRNFKKLVDKYGLDDPGIDWNKAAEYNDKSDVTKTFLYIFETGIRLGLAAKQKTKKIEVPVKDGTIVSEASGDTSYPGIYTFLRKKDGTEVDLCYAEGKYHYADEAESQNMEDMSDEPVQDHGVNVFVWGDPSTDEYTQKIPVDTNA